MHSKNAEISYLSKAVHTELNKLGLNYSNPICHKLHHEQCQTLWKRRTLKHLRPYQRLWHVKKTRNSFILYLTKHPFSTTFLAIGFCNSNPTLICWNILCSYYCSCSCLWLHADALVFSFGVKRTLSLPWLFKGNFNVAMSLFQGFWCYKFHS